MQFSEWEPIYKKILEDFGWERKKDEKAAGLLSKIISGRRQPLKKLERLIRNKHVLVVGPASPVICECDTIICAGSAASVLRSMDIIPQILVTDLDGNLKDQIFLNRKGSITLIHAHGDNVHLLKRTKEFIGDVIGTTQASSLSDVHNFGGFTDGDRCVCLAAHFGAKKIFLTGFDFENPVGASKDLEIKKKKLEWAKRIIERFDVDYSEP